MPGCAPMTVCNGDGIKAAYLTPAMETDPSPPQAPPSRWKRSAAESEERDLPADRHRRLPEGPERRLAAGLGQTQPMRGQALSTGRRKPAASRRSGRSDTRPLAEAGTAPDTANPVFQQALEILRREMPPPGQVQSPKSEVQSPESASPGARLRRSRHTPRSALRTPHSNHSRPDAQ